MADDGARAGEIDARGPYPRAGGRPRRAGASVIGRRAGMAAAVRALPPIIAVRDLDVHLTEHATYLATKGLTVNHAKDLRRIAAKGLASTTSNLLDDCTFDAVATHGSS
eukprot:COSAG02_NODE_8064_length_2725_cov_1.835110_2_plen_108_part_01